MCEAIHGPKPPYHFDAAILSPQSRARLFWTSFDLPAGRVGGLKVVTLWGVEGGRQVAKVKTLLSSSESGHYATTLSERIGSEAFLDKGVRKYSDNRPFPTAVRWVVRSKPPVEPAGIEDCDADTRRKWEKSGFALPPYQFKKELGVVTDKGVERPTNADERERLHGFATGHTRGYSEAKRISFIGNSFHCVVVAHLLASWAVLAGYLVTVPAVSQLWAVSLHGPEYHESVNAIGGWGVQGAACFVNSTLPDPGVHVSDCDDSDYGLGDLDYGLGDETVATILPAEEEESVFHLVQEEETIAELHHCTIPPDEYYEKLSVLWKEWWPKCNPALLIHMMSVLIAFDTATAFAMSLGIAKFDLAQEEAKLVGEIVGKNGRKPNPAIVRAIKNWPPIYTLKQLQEFLGTINYVRPHCGPAYCRVADPLRPLLKPTAVFPPNEAQIAALEALKELVLEHHYL